MIICQHKLNPSNPYLVLVKTNLILEQLQGNEGNTDSVQAINYPKMVKWRKSAV